MVRLNNLKTRATMNTKISELICAEEVIYLYNLKNICQSKFSELVIIKTI